MFLNRKRRAVILGGSFALPLLLLSASASQAGGPPDAAALLTRMEDLYRNAKTFQATLTLKQNGKTQSGKPFTVNATQQIRYQSPNRFYVEEQYSGTGEAAQVSQRSQIKASDGRLFYLYMPARKQYAKQAAPPSVSLLRILANCMLNPSRFTMKMGTPTTVNGRAAVVILAQPKAPTQFRADITEPQKAAIIKQIKEARPTQVVIDKQTNQLLRLSGGSPVNAEEIVFTSQSVNGTLAAKTFTFRPPAGAKEVVPQPGTGQPKK